MPKGTMHFPADFLWGTATAAYHVEGNITNSDWWTWEQIPGAILENHKSGLACNWWENAEADLDRAAAMGTNAHRMSVDWSRIEPEPGNFDAAALNRYRAIVQAMVARGIEPMVTLHHFTNPRWLVQMGDFNNEQIVNRFQSFTLKVVEAIGDLVPKWITINEPMVYFVMRWLEQKFPPAQKSGYAAGFEAVRNMLRCHAAAYQVIKRRHPEAMVGVAKQFRPIHAPKGGLPATLLAKQIDYLFTELWMDAMTDGKLRLPVGRGTIDGLADSYDFVGINYYTYSNVAWPPGAKLYDETYPEDAIVGDGNYGEVYPQGLFDSVVKALKYKKPILITENGMPDADDDHRPGFLLTHLRELWRGISFNYPILGYYHWSLIDNFEWERGWTQRFGLIELDTETQIRTLRRSGELYAEICKSNGISSTMVAEYAPSMLSELFPG